MPGHNRSQNGLKQLCTKIIASRLFYKIGKLQNAEMYGHMYAIFLMINPGSGAIDRIFNSSISCPV